MAQNVLAASLRALDPQLMARLRAHGFDPDRLAAWAATLREGDPATRRDTRNRVQGEVRAPGPDELWQVPPPASPEAERLAELGRSAMARGELAFCVMAGGMATRMGGVIKALVPAVDDKTFLDIRLAENAVVSDRAGRPVPLWLMTSDATESGIAEALRVRRAPPHVRTFVQDLSLRLSPEGGLFLDAQQHPSPYATGHGDLPDALLRSGLLRQFRHAGGKYVWITNVDNLGATVDPVLLGLFMASAAEVLVEVCDKVAGDRGGIPVHAQGRLQVLEEFRLPLDFDAASVRVFNTNTFLVRADALETAKIPWTYFEVEKKVDGLPAVQFERLLQELTAHLQAAYVRAPRQGTESRFEPVKDTPELERRRPAIQAILKARGIL